MALTSRCAVARRTVLHRRGIFLPRHMSASIKVGDLVTRGSDLRLWRVVDVYPDLGFARLEVAGEAWVRSATADLTDLQPYHRKCDVV